MAQKNIAKKKGAQGVICSLPCTSKEEELIISAKGLSSALKAKFRAKFSEV